MLGRDFFDLAICNQTREGELPEGSSWVMIDDELEDDYAIYRSDLLDESNPGVHDSAKLTQVLVDLLQERTGPLIA